MTNPAEGNAIIVFTRSELEAVSHALYVCQNEGLQDRGPGEEAFGEALAKVEDEIKTFEARDRRRDERKRS